MLNRISRRSFIKNSLILSSAIMIPGFSSVFAADNPSVRTKYGIFDGFIDKRGVKTFLGIPYALAPVKNLRWRAPVPTKPSDKHFSAKNLGFSPMQDVDRFEEASFHEMSEDCLTLNVWTRSSGKNLPVMVWIHGGGFLSGGSADPLYDLSAFASNYDGVFVSINYRLNIFGFMNFSSVDSDYFDSGYLGIKDQITALKWIKENIADFGGDPENITIFGESAGSISIMMLLVTPDAKNLFQKAIAQSGNSHVYNEPQESAKLAEEFMNMGGYKNMNELLSKSTQELSKNYDDLCHSRVYNTETDYLPTCDGKYLPLNPFKELKNGKAREIKLMTGNMAEEYRYWNLYWKTFTDNLEEFHDKTISNVYDGEVENIARIYAEWRKKHAEEPYLEFADQLDWRVGQELSAEYQSEYNDVYFYLFSQKSPYELLGSCHALDLVFIFGNADIDMEPNPDKNLIKAMQETWFSFAATGNPNNELIPEWKQYKKGDRHTMEINSKFWKCQKDLNTENLSAMRSAYENRLSR